MDRRGFVEITAGTLLSTGLAACASLVTVPVEARNGRIRLRLADHPSLAHAGGALRIQPIGAEHPLVVLSLEAGEYAVLSPVCTHQGCLVEVAGPRLACPCHGSEYDRTGNVLAGPAERALARYASEVTSDGVLLIDFPDGAGA